MKFLSTLALVLLVVGCSSPELPDGKPAPAPNGAAAADANVDRTDPAAVTRAVLTAYKAKDLKTVAEFCDQRQQKHLQEVAAQGDKHPSYAKIFSAYPWPVIQKWQGDVGEVRYAAADEAYVAIAKQGSKELPTLVLKKVDGKWCYSDVQTPDAEDFEGLPSTPPS